MQLRRAPPPQQEQTDQDENLGTVEAVNLPLFLIYCLLPGHDQEMMMD